MAAVNRPAIDPEEYNRILGKFELKSIRLHQLTVTTSRRPERGEKPRFDLDYVPEIHAHESDILCRAGFGVRMSSASDEPLVEIAAEYDVLFSTEEEPSQEFFEVFFKLNLNRMVYPFFRELVASTTSRMDLPMLVVPLNIFNPHVKPRSEKQIAKKKQKKTQTGSGG